MAAATTRRNGSGNGTTKAAAAAERPASLTPDVLAELRRPFSVAAIRFKPQTVTKDKTKAMGTFYIDARLAAERLNAIVGPEGWTDAYTPLFADVPQAHASFHFPVECRLTVLGVTKVDVGVYQSNSADSLAVKSAYSDSLKRAAVKFGIGASLYACPKVWAPVDTYGEGDRKKVRGFSAAGERALRDAYAAFLASDACRSHFGDALDHGDVMDDPDVTPEPELEPAAPELASPESIDRLVELAKQAGVAPEAVAKAMENAKANAGGALTAAWVATQTAAAEANLAEGGEQGNA